MRVWIAGIFWVAISVIGSRRAFAQLDDPLSEYQQPGMNLPDPLADNGKHFSPSVATAGSANAGPTLTSVGPDNKRCSTLNPCALPTPALNSQPPGRQISGRAKSNSSS